MASPTETDLVLAEDLPFEQRFVEELPLRQSLAVTITNIDSKNPKREQRTDGEYVRRCNVRNSLTVTPAKSHSEPRLVAANVKKREDKKVAALPPPSSKSKPVINQSTHGGGNEFGSNGEGEGRDGGGDGDGDQGNDDGRDDELELANDDGVEDEQESDDEFQSASSTPWPEDAWTDLASSERDVLPNPVNITAALQEYERFDKEEKEATLQREKKEAAEKELKMQEELQRQQVEAAELAVRRQQELQRKEKEAAENALKIRQYLQQEKEEAAEQARRIKEHIEHQEKEATQRKIPQHLQWKMEEKPIMLSEQREFRQRQDLCGPSWQDHGSGDDRRYRLYAKVHRVWRYRMGDSTVPTEREEVPGELLERVGWFWIPERRFWTRAWTREEGNLTSLLDGTLRISSLPENIDSIMSGMY